MLDIYWHREIKVTMFNFSVLDQNKIQNLIREGRKKLKNIEPIFGKVNEGDQIKKTSDKSLEKLLKATKKTKLLTYFKKSYNESDEKKQAKKK